MNAPTGAQYTLTLGDQRATITEMGAGLRAYRVAGTDVVTTFDEIQLPDGCQGQQLMPWPNRIRDGKWQLDGTEHQLEVNEPERGNAIHGLVRDRMWTLVELGEDHLTQRLLLEPEQGWPGTLELLVTHQLSAAGLGIEVTARNLGTTAAPFGYAAHPYLLPPDGSAGVDQCSLFLPFASRLEVDGRLLPVGLRDVAGTPFDRRHDGALDALELDTAFTAPRLAEGRWEASLSAGSSRTVVWGDQTMGWVQVYTPGDRASVAVEPMTVGPDAFNDGPTHADLVLLAPGETVTCRWGLRHEVLDV
ncbi:MULTISPECIES: aldose 1-epimerase family protein [Luteococcus]|uniref:Putative aldose-1-epimerase n=1 Tax=Luteococcus japonicus LSP_Lj1 TaxID=1255658 RepID=A0A1R4JSZ6_9ACTN|nr:MULTISPECIES: aldose 1-epimerase family protein [Luteococcus]MDN5563349.1 aldose 1-epimerase family protein [Luteococcus sp.]SJN35034.1 putative aldose-1-epimerase [Luteococcus japonicus LSP_Lj1]